jgi:hypothetical protein
MNRVETILYIFSQPCQSRNIGVKYLLNRGVAMIPGKSRLLLALRERRASPSRRISCPPFLPLHPSSRFAPPARLLRPLAYSCRSHRLRVRSGRSPTPARRSADPLLHPSLLSIRPLALSRSLPQLGPAAHFAPATRTAIS